MTKCPYCGRELREHERYCDFCEQDLTEAIGEKLKMKKEQITGPVKEAIRKFKDITKKVILMHFSQKPSKFGYHFTTWTLPRFRKHLMDYKVVDSISIERLRQILDEANARLRRSKRWQYSPDKEFHKKNLR